MSGNLEDHQERRKAERIRLSVEDNSATLYAASEKHYVKIIDISITGMKIWGFELDSGQNVSVEWSKGNRIEAVVAWSIGQAVGLKFKHELESDHPLFSKSKMKS